MPIFFVSGPTKYLYSVNFCDLHRKNLEDYILEILNELAMSCIVIGTTPCYKLHLNSSVTIIKPRYQ
jgi:hypothetical protein